MSIGAVNTGCLSQLQTGLEETVSHVVFCQDSVFRISLQTVLFNQLTNCLGDQFIEIGLFHDRAVIHTIQNG